jgi:predicted ATP-dependent serine protease
MRRGQRVTENIDPNTSIFHTTSLEDIIATLEDKAYDIVIVDSIQTIASHSADGVA